MYKVYVCPFIVDFFLKFIKILWERNLIIKIVLHSFQISTIAESEDSQESVDSVTDSQKRREILSRRPSYRYEI